MSRKVIWFFLVATAVLSSIVFTPKVHAVGITVTVTSTSDASDRNVGDGLCDVSVNPGEQCTLRAALEELYALAPGATPHRIEFNIPGTGPFTFLPNTDYPRIRFPTEIAGETQPGSSCPTANDPADIQIMIDGRNSNGYLNSGLLLYADDSSISGLSIVNFEFAGIEGNGDNTTIRCNHIGLDSSGYTPLGNSKGIDFGGDNNTVGGSSFADRNVISGNYFDGVQLYGTSSVVAGNYIGVAADGIAPMGNGHDGLSINADNTTVGGFTVSERNVIANNGFNGALGTEGIIVYGDNVTILNNYIGVDKNGGALGNAGHGVWLYGNGATVGNANAPNLIAHNAGNGIYNSSGYYGSEENALRVNIIRDNGLLGIDLEGPGEIPGDVTPNDPDDTDSGANGLQNYPVLGAADINGRIQGTINGFPNNDLSLFFYLNDSCDASGFGEGEQFLQAVDVTIPGSGDDLDFDTTLNAPLPAGKYVTATAIDIDNENTSEFSNCVQVSEITYEVSSTSDLSDRNLGDGRCDVSVNVGDQCTLRAAIEEINNTVGNGPYRISFNISGVGPHIIAPNSSFDTISKSVIIDGISQPEATCPIDSTWWLPNNLPANLQIVLDGSNVPDGSGLTLAPGSSGSEVRGLVIGDFPDQGIQIASNDNLIACNHIGIDAAGTAVFGNGLNGIWVSGDNNRIGGLHSSSRNVISGNEANGIFLFDGANDNRVQGNFIGTNAAGDGAIGNVEAGIRLRAATNNRIGGGFSNARNLISGNRAQGIHLRLGADGNEVWGNTIGTDRAGVTAVPNQAGIFVYNAHNNELGGNTANKGNLIAGNSFNGLYLENGASANLIQFNRIGLNQVGDPLGNGSNGIRLGVGATATQIEANAIAYNGEAGVELLDSATQNSSYGNSIHENGELGIDLNGDGLTANDLSGDPDTGANNLQNFPDMRSANPLTGDISGTMESAPSTEYRLDFYRSTSCDPSDYGEGEIYLGTGTVTTDATGEQNFTIMVGGFALNDFITATATDPNGNTSEFSICFPAGGSPPTE